MGTTRHLPVGALFCALLLLLGPSTQAQTPGSASDSNCAGRGDRSCAATPTIACPACPDPMDVAQYRFIDLRRMLRHGETPSLQELQGRWRGVNKGVATLVIDSQFIKEIHACGCQTRGENIFVHQVPECELRARGWQPKIDTCTGQERRIGKFAVLEPNCRGPRGHAVTFFYDDPTKSKLNPERWIVDKVVKLDANHMLGRACVRVAGAQVPVAYFILERME